MGNTSGSWGNKVDEDVFCESINRYARGEITQVNAAKMCGISTPTWCKWANKYLWGEPMPSSFFKAKDKC